MIRKILAYLCSLLLFASNAFAFPFPIANSYYVPLRLSYVDAQDLTGLGQPATQSYTINIGTAAPDRLVVVCLRARRDSTIDITSATIGGNAATVHAGTATGTGATFLISAPVASGTTATMSVTWSVNAVLHRYAVYSLTGQHSNTPVATDLVTTAGTARTSTKTIGNRTAVLACDGSTTNVSYTWSGTGGVTEDSDGASTSGGAFAALSTASAVIQSGGSNLTFTSTASGTTGVPQLALAAWQ